jgi:hypothetical protein
MSPSIFSGRESYVAFLAAYPFPAFVLDRRLPPGKHGPSLQPVYGNKPYLNVFGPEYSHGETLVSVGGLVEALGDIDEAQRLSAWLQWPPTDTDENPWSKTDHYTIVLSLRPSWLLVNDKALKLEITKTMIDDFWVCTSVPQVELPAVQATPPSSSSSHSSDGSRRTAPNLRIPNFPTPPTFDQIQQQSRTSSKYNTPPSFLPPTSPYIHAVPGSVKPTLDPLTDPSQGLVHSPLKPISVHHPLETVPPSYLVAEIDQMIETFPWETTELGPKEGWSQALKTTLSICLRSPTSVSEAVKRVLCSWICQ